MTDNGHRHRSLGKEQLDFFHRWPIDLKNKKQTNKKATMANESSIMRDSINIDRMVFKKLINTKVIVKQ